MKTRRRSKVALALGSLALIVALAPAPQQVAQVKVGQLKELAEAKAAVARKIADFFADPRLAELEVKGISRGIPGADQVEVWTRRVVDSRLDAAPNLDARVAILQDDVDRTKAIEARLKAIAQDEPGMAKLDALKAEYYRLDAEYRLAKEKGGR
jgi:uncharacterized small protein (DUF1192 family)